MHDVQKTGTPIARYHLPDSVEEAVALLAEYRAAARIVAGATDLIPELHGRVRPGVTALIDITGIADLDRIDVGDGTFTIGPLVTHNQIVASDALWERATPLAQACREIGSAQLRNRATVVGNVVTASPANDTISALRVLDAVVTLVSAHGVRVVPLVGFHTGVRQTAMRDDEMVTGIEFRALDGGERGIFVKLGNRRAQAISVVHAALTLDRNGRGRAALGSVAPTIVEYEAEDLADDDAVDRFATLVARRVSPIDDVRASARYREAMVEVMLRRGFRALRSDPSPRPDVPLLSPTGTSHRARSSPSTMDSGGRIAATINGREVAAAGEPAMTLLDWLRDRAGPALSTSLTGTKEGCAEGECGACTVILDGSAVMACLVPAPAADGSEVTTVEGVGRAERLHPVQDAFVDRTAVQCGYCIPGFIVAAAALLDERPRPDREAVVEALAGNLCRCTGYYKIIEAVQAAAGAEGTR